MRTYLSRKMSPFVKGFIFTMGSILIVAGLFGLATADQHFSLGAWLGIIGVLTVVFGFASHVIRILDRDIYFNLEDLTIASGRITRVIRLIEIDSVFLLVGYGWITYTTKSGQTNTIMVVSPLMDIADQSLSQLKGAVARAKGIEHRNRVLSE